MFGSGMQQVPQHRLSSTAGKPRSAAGGSESLYAERSVLVLNGSSIVRFERKVAIKSLYDPCFVVVS